MIKNTLNTIFSKSETDALESQERMNLGVDLYLSFGLDDHRKYDSLCLCLKICCRETHIFSQNCWHILASTVYICIIIVDATVIGNSVFF